MWTASAFKFVMMLLRFLATTLSYDAFYTKPSWRFVESPRRIDNWIRGSPINRDTKHAYVVEEYSRWTAELFVNHFRRFYESPRSIDTLCSISRRKLENRWLSCQSFLEIHRISKKFWYEMHQYLNWLSKIEGISLKLKKQKEKGFYSGLDKSIQPQKNVRISCDSPFKGQYLKKYIRYVCRLLPKIQHSAWSIWYKY
jgi:hypothetical protein